MNSDFPFHVFQSAEEGNIDNLKIALNYDDNNVYINEFGYTALHMSGNNGHGACVKLLLDNGFDVALRDIDGYTALHRASQNGHVHIAEILLRYGIDINIKANDNSTALHDAACFGHSNLVQFLLDNGIDVECKMLCGTTALILAAERGHRAVVEILIDHGADIINCNGRFGMNALLKSARYGHTSVVLLLLDNGIDINSRNYDGWTALHFAAQNSRIKIVLELLERGINIFPVEKEDIDNDGTFDLYDIDLYSPIEDIWDQDDNEGDSQDGNEVIDCVPIILAEIEHRRKRAAFDSIINHYIEYQPYRTIIYTICCQGNLVVAQPKVGWLRAEAVRDKYYWDEIFFYLHQHILANFYGNEQTGAIMTTSSLKSVNRLSNESDKTSTLMTNHSDKTSTLMTVLTDRLKMYLKPQEVHLE